MKPILASPIAGETDNTPRRVFGTPHPMKEVVKDVLRERPPAKETARFKRRNQKPKAKKPTR